MSNRNNKGTQVGQNQQQGKPEEPGKAKKEKRTLRQRYHDAKHKILSHKSGRIAVKVVKGIGVGAVGVGSFFIGRKTAKPTVVYVQPVEPETETEAPAEETPTEEAEENGED